MLTFLFFAALHDTTAREVDELTRQNAVLVGHSNHKQKIQMHLKVKEENNQLKLEKARMAEALKARDDHIRKLVRIYYFIWKIFEPYLYLPIAGGGDCTR